jgi:tetratricopeptide (TPR) repeat protein
VPLRGIQEALAAAGKPRNARVNAELAHELAYRRSVRAIVAGSITRAGHTYVLTARAEDVDSARVIATVTEVAKNDDGLIPAAARIGTTLRRRLGEAGDAVRATRALNLVRTSSFEALKLTENGLWLLQAKGDFHGAAEQYRRATLLDSEFVDAWSGLAIAKTNAGERDSALVFLKRALQLTNRMSEARRLGIEGSVAFAEDDVPRSASLYRRSLALGNLPIRTNLANRLASLGRLDEALAVYKDLLQDPWGSKTAETFNEWVALLCLGRVDEAAQVSAKFTPPHSITAPANNALVGGKWQLADSLGSHLFADEAEDPGVRWEGGMVAAGAATARGALARARAHLDRMVTLDTGSPASRKNTLFVATLLDLLAGHAHAGGAAPAASDSGEFWRGYQAIASAVDGDTARSRASIVRLRGHAPRWEARLMSAVAEGLIDSRAGRYERVVEQLGPTARSRLFESRLPVAGTAYVIRWLVGNAWERLGKPDSAAVYYELAQETGRSPDADFYARAVTLPFALQRLVVLNARMGRYEVAGKRWEEFQRLVTEPDDEFRPIVAQARLELANALTREGPARR